MEKRLIHFVISFPAGNKTPVIAEPGNGAFDFPAAFVTAKRSPVLTLGFFAVAPVRSDQFNPQLSEFISKGIRVVSFVADQISRFSFDRGQRLVRQFHLMRGGRVKGHSQRNTLAVRQNHELRALAPLGFADFRPPFLAGMKLPSIKHSAHWTWPFLSNSWIKVLQILSQRSFSSHILRRLQHVLGLGYFSGRSFQRAPVRKTHRIPSKTRRLSFQGLPLLLNFGSNGSIFCHCRFVRYTARLIGLPPISHCIKKRYQCL